MTSIASGTPFNRQPPPNRYELEEDLHRHTTSREMPVLSYRVPKTPNGRWLVHLRSWTRPVSLTSRECQALLWGLRDGIDSCTPSTVNARRHGAGTL